VLEDRLDARKIIDRAKGVLMDSHGQSESESFRFIQAAAMSQRLTMRAISQQIIDGTLAPTEAE
jgi:two-component system, response regulator PdtaR